MNGTHYAFGWQAKPGHPHEVEKNYEEIATIDLVCHRYRLGDSLHAVARWLNHTGVRNRAGNDWQATQIRRILKRAGLV